MDRRQIATILVLDNLGIKPSVEGFDQRLILQKAIYLAQVSGVDLGYFYGWYLRGPYCSAVARDVFSALENPESIDSIRSKWSLDTSLANKLSKLRNILQTISTSTGDIEKALPRWLELLASVHYLITRKQVDANGAKEIAEHLKKFNKNFNAQEVQKAIDALKGSGFKFV